MQRQKLLLILTAILQSVGCSSAAKPTDHFDGKRFFNPEGREVTGFSNLLKVMYTLATSEDWPEQKNVIPQPLPEQPEGDQITVTFVNHSTFVIQSSKFVILTDPVWSKRASPFSFAGPKRNREPGVSFDSLRKVDIVLLSHNHYDHTDIPTIEKLKKKFDPYFVVGLGDKKRLEDIGITKVQELDWWQAAVLPSGIKIHYAPAQHFSGRGLFDRNKSLWGSYMISVQDKLIYFGGDTGYASHFKQIHERFGAPYLSLLPIGAYEPYWFMGPIHMNPEDAVKAHIDLKSKRSIGMHFGTFKLTTEPIDQPIKELETSLKSHALEPGKFRALQEGASIKLIDHLP